MWNVCLDFHMLSLLLLTYSENFIEMLDKYLQLKQQQKQQRHPVMTEQYSVGSWKQKTLNTTSE